MNDQTPASAKAAPVKQSALAVMAGRFNVEPNKLLETLKGTVFKGATNEELLALVVVANEYKLNPFTRQIYAFPAKGGGITPVVSIDGWISVLNRQDAFDGIEFNTTDKEGQPFAVEAVIHVKGRNRPVKVTEYYSECFRATEPWKSMPRRMLRHKALAQGARVAFGLSGIYDEDEAASLATDPLAAAKNITPAPEPQTEKPADEIQIDTTKAEPTASKEPSHRQQLEQIVTEAGFTFNDLQRWGIESGNIPDADSISGFAEIHDVVARRLVRAKGGMLSQLAAMKGATQ